MTDKIKSFWERHWSWLIQLCAMVFTAGAVYASVNAAINNKPDRTEMIEAIDIKIQKHVQESKEVYVRIDQVPGLNEKFDNIQTQLKNIQETNSLIMQKIMKSNK